MPAPTPLPATATGAVFDIDWTPAALVRSAVEDAQADADTDGRPSWPTFDRGGLPWPTGPPVYAAVPPGVRDDGVNTMSRGYARVMTVVK